MQAELNGAKHVPETNAKKCMQNGFPDNGRETIEVVLWGPLKVDLFCYAFLGLEISA